MKKVNFYKVFTNKMIQLNEKKNAFYAKNNFLLIVKSI